MPYRIDKTKNGYKLWNLKKKSYVNKIYKTKQAAINSGKNFMRYRREEPILKNGNYLYDKKNCNKK